jgi:hypothetical protein
VVQVCLHQRLLLNRGATLADGSFLDASRHLGPRIFVARGVAGEEQMLPSECHSKP